MTDTEYKRKFLISISNLASNQHRIMLDFGKVYTEEYQKKSDQKKLIGEVLDLGDPDIAAVEAFIYKLDKIRDDAVGLLAYHRDIKPLLK